MRPTSSRYSSLTSAGNSQPTALTMRDKRSARGYAIARAGHTSNNNTGTATTYITATSRSRHRARHPHQRTPPTRRTANLTCVRAQLQGDGVNYSTEALPRRATSP